MKYKTKEKVSIVIMALFLLSSAGVYKMLSATTEVTGGTSGSSSTSGDAMMNPSVDYIVSCLENVYTVLEIGVKRDCVENAKATVYFSSSLVNQSSFSEDDVVDKGTSSGGSIDIFSTYEDAKARDEELSRPLLQLFGAGGHRRYSTVVIRTSEKLSDSQQNELEKAIIAALKEGPQESPVEENDKSIIRVKIPSPGIDFIGKDYNKVVQTLEKAGFENIEMCPQYKLDDADSKSASSKDLVTLVTINGKTYFEQGKKVPADTPVVIEYLDFAKDNPNISEDESRSPANSDEFRYNDYGDVVTQFEKAGFSNVNTCAIYDLGTGWLESTDLGEVFKVSIDGKTSFKKFDVFPKDTEIIVYYRDFEINDPSLIYEKYTVKKLASDLRSNAYSAKATYLDKLVEIKGVPAHIDSDGESFMLYPTGERYPLFGVLCEVQTENQKEMLLQFKSGVEITVKGEITFVHESLGYTMDIYQIVLK